mgnify:CR=1 FL=1
MKNRYEELTQIEQTLINHLINTIAAHSLSDSGLTTIISETQNKIRDAKGASA